MISAGSSRWLDRMAVSSARGAFCVTALAAAMLLGGCSTVKVRLAMNEGVGHFKAKRFDAAVTAFKKAIAIDPQYSEAFLDLGLTYMEMYEPGSEVEKDVEYAQGAIDAFKQYIRITPDHEKVEGYLVNVCKLSHRMADVIEFYLEFFEKNPQDIILVKKIANLYHMSGDSENAVKYFEKVAQMEPANPEANYSVAVACWGRSYNAMNLDYEARMALLDKGIAAMERAISLRQDYFEAFSYLNLIYREKMKYDISPAQSVIWRQKADELQSRAIAIQNKVRAAAAAEAARQMGDKPAVPPPEGQAR